MKRRAAIKKVRQAARTGGYEFRIVEFTNHTSVGVGPVKRTIGRHSEISDSTVRAWFKQFDVILGKDWWR